MKATFAGIIVLAACGTSGSPDSGADAAQCTDPAPECCASCLNDVKEQALCSGGTWTCLEGVTAAQCVGKCTTTPFCIYLPKPECASCTDGTMTHRVCDEDAGKLECPAGTHDKAFDAGCSSDAAPD